MQSEVETETETETTAPRNGGALRQQDHADDMAVRDWLESIGGGASLKVALSRIKPKIYKGRTVGGLLENYDEMIDEESIREVWGGGKFQLKVTKMRENGQYKYLTARTIDVAGDPLMGGEEVRGNNDPAPAVMIGSSDDEGGGSKRVLDAMERMTERAEQRADRVERAAPNGGAIDPVLLQSLQRPLIEQLNTLRETNREQSRQMQELLNRPAPVDQFRDKMMMRLVDDDSIRLKAQREAFDSETRQIKQAHIDDIKEMRRSHEKEVERLERAHQRELDLVTRTNDTTSKVLDSAQSIRGDAHRSEIDRLSRELTKAEAELAALRAKKDKSILESAREIKELKEALNEGGKDDDADDGAPKAWWEKLVSMAGNSEAVMRLIGVAPPHEGGEPQHQIPSEAQAEQMLPPVGIPFQGPDGLVYVRQPDNTVRQVDLEEVRRARAAAKRRPKPEGAPEGQAPPPLPPMDPAQVRLAVTFMENAVTSGTDPAAFAASARSMVPASIVAYIQQVGVDVFLSKVARLDPGSVLMMQHGKNWAREVAKVLVGEAGEAA